MTTKNGFTGIEVGSKLTIYQDPYTRQKEEGRATITKIISESEHEIHLKVRFEDEPEVEYPRVIAKVRLKESD